MSENLVYLIAEIYDDSDFSDLENEIESSGSSSSDEDSEERMMVALALANKRGKLVKRPRIEFYVERVVSRYSAEEFKSHFRMNPETAEFVLSIIGETISTTKYAAGRKPIPAKKQLLITLWVMATPDSYRSVCEKFDVGRATAIRTVRRVSYALYCVAPNFIQWPTGDRAIQVMRQFETFSAFPQIIGAIDGTHISINAPQEDSQSYINRKGTHSIQVQAVSTHNLLFTSVFAGNAGCVHDARVFRLSPAQKYFERPEVFFPNDSHIVGDAAYGIHPNLKNFNFCLSSARISIERCFGLWKVRWRSILHVLPMVTLKKIPEYLIATCVLHNICILKGDMIPVAQILRTRRRGRLLLNGRIEGEAKRQRITDTLIIRNN